MIIARRKFLAGMFSLAVAAPAIVRAASLMPVKRVPCAYWRGVPIYLDETSTMNFREAEEIAFIHEMARKINAEMSRAWLYGNPSFQGRGLSDFIGNS